MFTARLLSRSTKAGNFTDKGTRSKHLNNKRTFFHVTMASITLILLCISLNIFLMQSLASVPSCNSEECSQKSSIPSSKYIATKDDPRYNLTTAEYQKLTFTDLHSHLDCYEHAINHSKPNYTPEMYQHMRTKYTELTGYTFPPLTLQQDVFHIAQSEEAGRGVFASRFIHKGEIIPFHATCSVVTFSSGELWREYVFSLPQTMGCDVMEWTWTQNVSVPNNVQLCLSIGDGDSFLNNADEDEDINIAPVDEFGMKFWAVKDIQKGEELIYDYEIFEPTEYERFGLGVLV